jgi:hypothetical protein
MHEVPAALQRTREIADPEKITLDDLYVIVILSSSLP